MGHVNGSNNNSGLVKERTGCTVINNQGLEMTCVEYNNALNIVVEFKNPYYRVDSNWGNFTKGKIRNPYLPTIYGVGIIGNKYKTRDGEYNQIKEYQAWCDMLFRTYGCTYDNSRRAKYIDCYVCNEWLYYENFYEWLHSQDNFDKWLNGKRWCLDKDILYNNNKMYAPDKCCLVPNNVNTLFVKRDAARGELPIGVQKNHDRFCALCSNPINKKYEYFGTFDTPEEAFMAYKNGKENIIKQVAQIEFNAGNITQPCYNAMLDYKVNITD